MRLDCLHISKAYLLAACNSFFSWHMLLTEMISSKNHVYDWFLIKQAGKAIFVNILHSKLLLLFRCVAHGCGEHTILCKQSWWCTAPLHNPPKVGQLRRSECSWCTCAEVLVSLSVLIGKNMNSLWTPAQLSAVIVTQHRLTSAVPDSWR